MLHSICEEEVGIAAQCKVTCCMFFNIACTVYKVCACVAFKLRIGTVNVHYFVVMQSCAVKYGKDKVISKIMRIEMY